jgi:hypothetical protein
MSRVPRLRAGRLAGAGFPDELRLSLIYTEELSFTSTTGAVSSQSYLGSDCFDPNNTGTGGQPAWFDTLMTVYSQGYVHASRLLMTCKSSSATVTGEFVVASTSNTGPSAIYELYTQPNAKQCFLTQNSPSFVFDLRDSFQNRQGVSDRSLKANSNMWFSSSASPSTNWIWRIKYQSADGASTSTALVDVKLIFDVTFFRRLASDDDLLLQQQRLIARNARLKKHLDAQVNGRTVVPEMVEEAKATNFKPLEEWGDFVQLHECNAVKQQQIKSLAVDKREQKAPSVMKGK